MPQLTDKAERISPAAYWELLMNLTRREVKGRYSQSFFGIAWAIAQPLAVAIHGVERGGIGAEPVVLIGAGGIGQSVIQALRISAAGRIVVIDANPDKEAVARLFGATDFINGSALTGDGELVAAVNALGEPAIAELLEGR